MNRESSDILSALALALFVATIALWSAILLTLF